MKVTRFWVALTLVIESGAELTIDYGYDTARVDARQVETWHRAFACALDALARTPDALLGTLSIADEATRNALAQAQDTARAWPAAQQQPLHLQFADAARATPDAIALEYEDVHGGVHRATYRELDVGTSRIAAALRRRGVQPDTPVALCVERSFDMVMALVGVLKAGAAYLPIDPADVGRSYEAVIRINSQSGKGGVAYVMERDHGFRLPRNFQIEFSREVQRVTNATGCELTSREIGAIFEREYLAVAGPYQLTDFSWNRDSTDSDGCHVKARLERGAERIDLAGSGGGPVHAFVEALNEAFGTDLEVRDYNEHAMGVGADAKAVAYVELANKGATRTDSRCGVAIDDSIVVAPVRALVSAFNRLGQEALRPAREIASR